MKCSIPSCFETAEHVYPDSSAPGCRMYLCAKHDEELHTANAHFQATASVFDSTTEVLKRIEGKIDDLIKELKS